MEATRYTQLKWLELAGEITQLELQPKYDLAPGCILFGKEKEPFRYVADFRYLNKAGEMVVEDVKGVRTALYIGKAHLMKTVHNIDICEITRGKKRVRTRKKQ